MKKKALFILATFALLMGSASAATTIETTISGTGATTYSGTTTYSGSSYAQSYQNTGFTSFSTKFTSPSNVVTNIGSTGTGGYTATVSPATSWSASGSFNVDSVPTPVSGFGFTPMTWSFSWSNFANGGANWNFN